MPDEYSTIQSAIDASFDGDSVLVSAGIYYENIIWPATNGIKLIGSGEDDCIIDGDSLANVIKFGYYLDEFIDSTTLITGFNIQNGCAECDDQFPIGGGMFLAESSPTLMGLTFSNNTAALGGGMYIYFDSNPTLTNVTFNGNLSLQSGGGMFLISSSATTLTNVTFNGNIALWYGGGMIIGYSPATLTNVIFSGNTASLGGGMYLEESSPNLTDVIFSNNTAFFGGGICLAYISNPTLTNSILWGNSPQEIYFYEDWDPSSITITYSDIQGGEAGIVTNDNGTVYWGDGNIDADPLFCDAENGDLTVQSDSPVLGAGQDGTDMGALGVGCEGVDECALGDLNCDGDINVLDVVIVVDCALQIGYGYECYDEFGDVNADGVIDILDIVTLVNWILNGMPEDTVMDIDGNIYQTVLIGEQLWMAENLKVTHYRNGDEIPTGLDNDTWSNTNEGAYSIYDDELSNADIYGNLYNWYAVDDDRGVCPDGWHVPSDDEYAVLTDYLGEENIAGGKMKEAGLEHWNSPNTGATNESGFTGLPAGYRKPVWGYVKTGEGGWFWSSSESGNDDAWHRVLHYYTSTVNRPIGYSKQGGFSIRCLKD